MQCPDVRSKRFADFVQCLADSIVAIQIEKDVAARQLVGDIFCQGHMPRPTTGFLEVTDIALPLLENGQHEIVEVVLRVIIKNNPFYGVFPREDFNIRFKHLFKLARAIEAGRAKGDLHKILDHPTVRDSSERPPRLPPGAFSRPKSGTRRKFSLQALRINFSVVPSHERQHRARSENSLLAVYMAVSVIGN
jgi:hypothetical protein